MLTEHSTPIDGKLAVGATLVELPLAKVPTREEVEQTPSHRTSTLPRAAGTWTLDAGRPVVAARVPLSDSSLAAGSRWYWSRWAAKSSSTTPCGSSKITAASNLGRRLHNDVMAYIPSRRVLTEGGYEGGGAMVYYGLPSPWTPNVEEETIVEAVDRLMIQAE